MVQVFKDFHSAGTELSRDGNRILGDKTGRTITRTTMDGASVITKGEFKPSGELVHTFMITTAVLIFSKRRELLIFGLFISLLLVVFYISGRE